MELCLGWLDISLLSLRLSSEQSTQTQPFFAVSKWLDSWWPTQPIGFQTFYLQREGNQVCLTVTLPQWLTSWCLNWKDLCSSSILFPPVCTSKIPSSKTLFSSGATGTERRMQPLLNGLNQMISNMEPVLDSRVLTTVIRGLWENIADDLYAFVESLYGGPACRVSKSAGSQSLFQVWVLKLLKHLCASMYGSNSAAIYELGYMRG